MWNKWHPGRLLAMLCLVVWTPLAFSARSTTTGGGAGLAGAGTSAPASGSPTAGRLMITDSWNDSVPTQLADQVQWLKAGGSRFAALALPATRAGAQRAALIVADLGQSPDTAMAGLLRRQLPGDGWFTLSIALPTPPVQQGIDSGEPTSAAAGATTTSTPEASATSSGGDSGRAVTIDLANSMVPANGALHRNFMASAVKRIAAAVSYLQNAGYRQLALIGVGHGADALMHAVADGKQALDGPGVAIVWIRPLFSGPESRDMGKVLGKGFKSPILDLVDPESPHSGYRRRAGSMVRVGLGAYSQQQLPISGPFSTLGGGAVVSRVSGWLDNRLAGVP